MQTGAEYIWRL